MEHADNNPKFNEDNTTTVDIIALNHFKMKIYNALVEVDGDNLPLEELWGLLGFQVQSVNEVDEYNFSPRTEQDKQKNYFEVELYTKKQMKTTDRTPMEESKKRELLLNSKIITGKCKTEQRNQTLLYSTYFLLRNNGPPKPTLSNLLSLENELIQF